MARSRHVLAGVDTQRDVPVAPDGRVGGEDSGQRVPEVEVPGFQEVEVPEQLMKPAGSPRSLTDGDPATLFRYDLVWEFVSAIVEGRQAVPSFHDGLVAQVVADSVLRSHKERKWVEIAEEPR